VNQDIVVLKIYEGERKIVNGNKLLGTLEPNELLTKMIGDVEIEVLFEMNPELGLTVTAKELEGVREVKVVFDDGKLTFERKDEVDKVLVGAKKFGEGDL
jgi:molecular chaperone DnaK